MNFEYHHNKSIIMDGSKYHCECGSIITNNKRSIDAHNSTKIHNSYIENKKLIEANNAILAANKVKANPDKKLSNTQSHLNAIKELHLAYKIIDASNKHLSYVIKVLQSKLKEKYKFIEKDLLTKEEDDLIKKIFHECRIDNSYEPPIVTAEVIYIPVEKENDFQIESNEDIL
jgi:hypothetical protein